MCRVLLILLLVPLIRNNSVFSTTKVNISTVTAHLDANELPPRSRTIRNYVNIGRDTKPVSNNLTEPSSLTLQRSTEQSTRGPTLKINPPGPKVTGQDILFPVTKKRKLESSLDGENVTNSREQVELPKIYKGQTSKVTKQEMPEYGEEKWPYSNKQRKRRKSRVMEDLTYNSQLKELLHEIVSSEDKVSGLPSSVENKTRHREKSASSTISTIEKHINEFSKALATAILKRPNQISMDSSESSKLQTSNLLLSSNTNEELNVNLASTAKSQMAEDDDENFMNHSSVDGNNLVSDLLKSFMTGRHGSGNSKNSISSSLSNYKQIISTETIPTIAYQTTKNKSIDDIVPLLISILNDVKKHTGKQIPSVMEAPVHQSTSELLAAEITEATITPTATYHTTQSKLPVIQDKPVIIKTNIDTFNKANTTSVKDGVYNIFEDTVLKMFDRLRELNNQLSKTEERSSKSTLSRQLQEEVSKHLVWLFLLIFVLLSISVYFGCKQARVGCCSCMPKEPISLPDEMPVSIKMTKTGTPSRTNSPNVWTKSPRKTYPTVSAFLSHQQNKNANTSAGKTFSSETFDFNYDDDDDDVHTTPFKRYHNKSPTQCRECGNVTPNKFK